MRKTWIALLHPLALALAVGGIACTQPRKDCTAGPGPMPFAAKYTRTDDSKSCDTVHGEVIGLEKYNPARTDNPEKEDFTKASLAIQSYRLSCLAFGPGYPQDTMHPFGCPAGAGALAPDMMHSVFSVGDFATATPDENNVCHVSTLSPAEQNIPAIPPDPDAGAPGAPAVDITYAWSDVRLFVTASAPGTQMAAHLTITQDGCPATYSVLAVWPAVSCAVRDPDSGAPIGADPTLCVPPGSGLNPDFKDNITCDPDLMLCVLKAPPPELR